MQTFRNHTPGFVLVLLVLATLVVVHQTPVRGAKAADDVNVINTPLPVSGAVSISGTPAVNINGTPSVNAAQNGPWTVGLANGSTVGLANGSTVGLAAGTTVGLAAGASVQVTNGAGNPVFTRDAGQPLQLQDTTNFGGSTVAVVT